MRIGEFTDVAYNILFSMTDCHNNSSCNDASVNEYIDDLGCILKGIGGT